MKKIILSGLWFRSCFRKQIFFKSFYPVTSDWKSEGKLVGKKKFGVALYCPLQEKKKELLKRCAIPWLIVNEPVVVIFLKRNCSCTAHTQKRPFWLLLFVTSALSVFPQSAVLAVSHPQPPRPKLTSFFSPGPKLHTDFNITLHDYINRFCREREREEMVGRKKKHLKAKPSNIPFLSVSSAWQGQAFQAKCILAISYIRKQKAFLAPSLTGAEWLCLCS